MKTQEMETVFGPVISSYSRAEAIEDGILVDVSETAREAGITYPVALSRRLWNEVVVPDDRSRPYGQSEAGRLWDVLFMLAMRARVHGGAVMFYKVIAIAKARQKRVYVLKAVVDGGDEGEPVITVMFPEED